MKVSRRHMVGWMGAAAVAVPSLASAGTPNRWDSPEEAAAVPALSAADLLAPLAVGSQLATWRIERLGRLFAGAVSVELSDASGERFIVDICARDSGVGAAEPPARTERCDLFVANEGSGHDPTHEDHGLAAMALAEIVRSHEHHADLSGLLTLQSRLALHGDEVVRGCA